MQAWLGRVSLTWDEWRAIGAVLMDGFVLLDDAADELGLTRRGKEHFAVDAPALFGRRNAETLEPLRQCGM